MRAFSRYFLGLLATAAATLLAAGPAAAGPAYVEDEVIVQFRPGTSAATARQRLASALPGATLRRTTSMPFGRLALAALPKGVAVGEMVARLKAQPGVVTAEPNYLTFAPSTPRSADAQPSPTLRLKQGVDAEGVPVFDEVPRPIQAAGSYPPEDPRYDQWGWFYTSANIVWPNKNASPVVAVLDTGADYLHPDLTSRVLRGYDYVNNDGDPMDDHGHGTHVAGIIAAAIGNKKGITGVSNGTVLAVKVLNGAGQGTHYDLLQGLNYASTVSGVRIINMSLGTTDESSILRQAIYTATYTRGRLVVAAAGNQNGTAPVYPAAYSVGAWEVPAGSGTFVSFADRVLAVGAQGVWVNPSGGGDPVFVEHCRWEASPTVGSNQAGWVNIVAPGGSILSTTPYNRDFYNLIQGDSASGYNTYSGTSMAAAFVSGAAARLWSIVSAYSNVQIAQRLTGNGWPAFAASTAAVDVDQDGTDDLAACWDPALASPGPSRTLPLADLDVAVAMQRSGIWGHAYDAANGLALTGATAQAYLGSSLKSVSGPIGGAGVPNDARYDILNVPWSATTYYWVGVALAGYTAGAQGVDALTVNGPQVWYKLRDFAVPRYSSNWTFVTTWGSGSTYLPMDQHLLLPVGAGGACDVGLESSAVTSNPANICRIGTLVGSPFTRYLHSSRDDQLALESTASRPPLYSTALHPYRVFLRDFNQGSSLRDPLNGRPVLRVWQTGAIRARVDLGGGTLTQSSPACTFDGGAADCSLWFAGSLSMTGVFTPANELGDGVNGAVIPFGGATAETRALQGGR